MADGKASNGAITRIHGYYIEHSLHLFQIIITLWGVIFVIRTIQRTFFRRSTRGARIVREPIPPTQTLVWEYLVDLFFGAVTVVATAFMIMLVGKILEVIQRLAA